MDLKAATVPELQALNVQLLRTIDNARRGNQTALSEAGAIAEKKAVQAELRVRGENIRPEVGVSTAESRARAQGIRTNPTNDELMRENKELRARISELEEALAAKGAQ